MTKQKNKLTKAKLSKMNKKALVDNVMNFVNEIPTMLKYIRLALKSDFTPKERKLLLGQERKIIVSLRGWKYIVELTLYDLKGLMSKRKTPRKRRGVKK